PPRTRIPPKEVPASALAIAVAGAAGDRVQSALLTLEHERAEAAIDAHLDRGSEREYGQHIRDENDQEQLVRNADFQGVQCALTGSTARPATASNATLWNAIVQQLWRKRHGDAAPCRPHLRDQRRLAPLVTRREMKGRDRLGARGTRDTARLTGR